jgi:hypothetical protein
MMRLAAILCGLWAVLTFAIADARAEKRVALVVGNSAYQNVSPLGNPAKDANAIGELFRKAGFDVVETKLDLGNLEFKRVARDFTAAARDADIAVVYFAGHGIEVNGTNYLLPVDAKLASDFDVEDEALSLDRVMRAIEPARRLRLVILDACRDNPFGQTMKRGFATRNVTTGLARIEPPSTDTLIAYATRPGSTADDGSGGNSPFTAALLKNLLQPGQDVRIALGHVRDDVMKATGSRQEPFVAGSLGGAVLALATDPDKANGPTRQISVLPNPQTPAEATHDPQRDYELAERVGTREGWDSFLATHPAGFYASLARQQRDRLVARSEPAAPVASPAEAPAPVPQVQQQIAALPAPNVTAPEPRIDMRAIARDLQVELRRVGCDPGGTDGNWSAKSQDAMNQFNRRARLDLDTRGATVTALEAVKVQRGRICPLICGSGQRADGERCVAIPAAPKPPAKREAARPERPRKAEPPARRPPPREAVRRERIRPPTDREIFGSGGGRPAGPPISIGIGGRGGIGIGVGF